MTINPTQNGPIQLSDNSGMVANGKAKLVSEALTPFVNGFRVSKDLSKLSDTRIRDVKSLDFSNAKKFFSSLAQAIRDICNNIDAFLSTPGQNLMIHNIQSQTSILLNTLKDHANDIKNLPNSNDAELTRAAEMLRERLDQLEEKVNNIGSGEGKAVLEKVRNQIKQALEILEPKLSHKVRGKAIHMKNKAMKGVENLSNKIEKGLEDAGNKIGQWAGNIIKKIKK